MTRALIMAGGADEKWTSLGGASRRHFQRVCGERVIDRIVRQLRERGVDDIGIICPPDTGYDVPGTWRVPPTHDAWGREGLNAEDRWSDTERTLMLYGDTIFTDAAMDVIVGYDVRRFMMFGRYDRGFRPEPWRIKGGGGELFAFSFWPEQRAEWRGAMEAAISLRDRGITKRAGAWEAYRYLGGARGTAVGRHQLYRRVFTNLRDMTDDFDTPAQFEKLRSLFEGVTTGR